jgi:hypothetical protein
MHSTKYTKNQEGKNLFGAIRMAANGWESMRMDENGSKWTGMDWKWLRIDGNGSE